MEKNKITIAVHNGSFHADDVFAVATLLLMIEEKYNKELSGEKYGVEVVRTRDPEVIKNATHVVDVGGVYDPETNRFDHHQEGGAGVREDGIPYASFGLVWKQYGEELSGSKEAAGAIEQRLVKCIDATDNGISVMKPEREGLYMYDIKDLVMTYGATWKEDASALDKNFEYLTSFAKKLMEREIKSIKDILESEKEVKEIMANNKDRTLLILDKPYEYEGVVSINPYILFVVSPKKDGGTWSVKTVRDDFRSFTHREGLPLEWAGKRDKDLVEITGVEDAIFCHMGRFIAVAQSKEGAIKLAELALKEAGK
ncbi:MAG: MYG1 family protein [Candidatus Zambryskibacteria bacterium]|nr:MYG1 family protein [Candidatus Zambryskibacteria bacterium]